MDSDQLRCIMHPAPPIPSSPSTHKHGVQRCEESSSVSFESETNCFVLHCECHKRLSISTAECDLRLLKENHPAKHELITAIREQAAELQ